MVILDGISEKLQFSISFVIKVESQSSSPLYKILCTFTVACNYSKINKKSVNKGNCEIELLI